MKDMIPLEGPLINKHNCGSNGLHQTFINLVYLQLKMMQIMSGLGPKYNNKGRFVLLEFAHVMHIGGILLDR